LAVGRKYFKNSQLTASNDRRIEDAQFMVDKSARWNNHVKRLTAFMDERLFSLGWGRNTRGWQNSAN
jgi:hypothetical protein